jgi:hypothetical protein
MSKKAQIKRSWIVYPPNYIPGDGYFSIPFLKNAWNKACELGEGSELYERVHKKYRNGAASYSTGTIYTVVRKRK